MSSLKPGSTIGILGSGQLGRMLALAARPFGYSVLVYAPDAKGSPAAQVADGYFHADYDDADSLRAFAAACDVVTVEFENIPSSTLETIGGTTTVWPPAHSLHTTQNRLREKTFLRERGLPHAEFREIGDMAALESAVAELGYPAVLKTAGFGYDGKGQLKLQSAADLPGALALLDQGPAVLEAFVPFARELSVVCARSADGGFASYSPFLNEHSNHILDLTRAGPGLVDEATATAAGELAGRVAAELGHVGVLCVELFQLEDGSLLVNELAPRVHNSGHLTIEASPSSQFQQHIRAVCGLPLGNTEFRSPAAMANLLGDVWEKGEPDWSAALGDPRVQLHLYAKAEARPGRKMGHLTALAGSADEAAEAVRTARLRAARNG